eukprot:CAMPEP_0172517626 /NCGR_PEP_ID=MMETSP1066-20121228/286635_1 /TAXON_ID=671091 /ORGANISM="Coscinodiscus wailesii, Strain CCMP2513" /LENGTH=77 /DNA_ID=CAMNT_0013299727 /DNA_START=995 /DNA_END=1228 /DNA_ORIENTATION=+
MSRGGGRPTEHRNGEKNLLPDEFRSAVPSARGAYDEGVEVRRVVVNDDAMGGAGPDGGVLADEFYVDSRRRQDGLGP